jgi:hypothetical protein
MATPSYCERMKAARAAERAKRLAEETARRRNLELYCEIQRMALEATKLAIRDRGDKVQHYKLRELKAMADAMIGPWLIAKAKARVAEHGDFHLTNVMNKRGRYGDQGIRQS